MTNDAETIPLAVRPGTERALDAMREAPRVIVVAPSAPDRTVFAFALWHESGGAYRRATLRLPLSVALEHAVVVQDAELPFAAQDGASRFVADVVGDRMPK